MVGSLDKRLERITVALFGRKADEYSELCQNYNIQILSTDDIWELIIASIEDRPVNPEVEERYNRPIPPNANSARIKRADQMFYGVSATISQERKAELLAEYKRGVENGNIIPGGYPDDLLSIQKQLLRETHGHDWYLKSGMAGKSGRRYAGIEGL